MLFYKLQAIIPGVEIPQDRQERSGFAQELQPKQELFYQKQNRKMYFCICQWKKNQVVMAAISQENQDIASFGAAFLQSMDLPAQNIVPEEITFEILRSLLRAAERNDFLEDDHDLLCKFNLQELQLQYCRGDYTEILLQPDRTQAQLLQSAEKILCQDTLLPEIQRIYQGAAHPQRGGHPVHYLIQTDDEAVQEEMLAILLTGLYHNRRIQSKRCCRIELENDRPLRFRDASSLYQMCSGGTMIVRFTSPEEELGEFSSSGTDGVLELCRQIRRYKNQVLTVLCLPRRCEKSRRLFLENLDNLTLVELNEEMVFEDKAKDYLTQLARDRGFTADEELYRECAPGKGHLAADLNRIFSDWEAQKMKQEVYPQYARLSAANQQVQKQQPVGSAFQTLEEMVGLAQAKETIRQALDYFKAQKLFQSKGITLRRPAMHMVFTGNPGTAKTTVARLFAQILKDNGLLPVGNLYELGRADLVGKYVGWTAPTVKEKFKQAKGSVLFIDEAYSLVDDRDGLYGDEAINTIVQEMENHREDLVVILAGYPDKMEQFLQKNPGLRSRIAFHVPFADYTARELMEITQLMTRKQQLHLAKGVRDKLLPLFALALQQPDFGNGRFVRNLLEKARMKQAGRLVQMDADQVTPEEVSTLLPEDFVFPALTGTAPKRTIGFGG